MAKVPSKIQLHRRSQVLELHFGEEQFELTAEFLRVHSPSAEVKGHGPGQEVLQTGKRHVAITDLDPQGNYAIRLIFDDGHQTGIYSWNYLYELGSNRDTYWQRYIERLNEAGESRDPDESAVKLVGPE